MIQLKNVAHYVTDKIDVSQLNVSEYITTDNMLPNRGGVVDCENLPQATRVTRYAPGDTLVSNIRPYFKKIWYADRSSGCSNDVIVFRPTNENWHSKFLYYVLSQDSFFDYMMAGANGTKMPRGNKKTIPDFMVPDFDLEKQTKISDTLSAYDNLIEYNQKQIKLLEEAAQRLYKEWFIDLRFPGYEDTPIVDDVPEGWHRCTFGDIDYTLESGSRPKGGIDASLKNGVPSIGAENVIGLGRYNYSSEKLVTRDFFSKMKRGKLKDRDILIYKDGAYIGRTSLFQDGFPYIEASVNEHVFLLHSNEELLQYYLFFTLYQQEYYLKMQKLNKNAAQPGINQTTMASLPLLIPTEQLLNGFDRFTVPIMHRIFGLAKQNRNLELARYRLLPKLMNGEIEV